jgi:hypothetical protein
MAVESNLLPRQLISDYEYCVTAFYIPHPPLISESRRKRYHPTMSKHLKVAIAQTCPKVAPTGKPDSTKPLFTILEANLLDARQWVEKAHQGNADVVVFPEYFLQGLVDSGRQVSALLVGRMKAPVSV